MTEKCPLDVYFDKNKWVRAIDRWNECGTVIGWSEPIKLTHPIGKMVSVGGWWIFVKDKDGSESGIHPKSITFCRNCPKDCKKKKG